MKIQKTLFVAILFMFSLQVFAVEPACSRPTELNCDYYQNCVESYLSCGSGGYALGYGRFYCQRFLDTNYTTYVGDQWRDATLLCLQRELSLFLYFTPYRTKTCPIIKKYAYETHANCYVRPEQGRPELSICYLPPADVLLTTQNLKAVDILRWGGLKQMAQVARLCLDLLNHTKAMGPTLEEQKVLWQSILDKDKQQ